MKRLNNLYDKICDMDNLNLAYHKARKGKNKQYGVQYFDKNLDENLKQLYKEMLERNKRFFVKPIYG